MSVATFGPAPDADGYSLLVDDAPGRAVSVNDSVGLTDLATGTHVLRLAGVATNCEVRDANLEKPFGLEDMSKALNDLGSLMSVVVFKIV